MDRKNWLYYYDHTQKKEAGQVLTNHACLLESSSSFVSGHFSLLFRLFGYSMGSATIAVP